MDRGRQAGIARMHGTCSLVKSDRLPLPACLRSASCVLRLDPAGRYLIAFPGSSVAVATCRRRPPTSLLAFLGPAAATFRVGTPGICGREARFGRGGGGQTEAGAGSSCPSVQGCLQPRLETAVRSDTSYRGTTAVVNKPDQSRWRVSVGAQAWRLPPELAYVRTYKHTTLGTAGFSRPLPL